MTYDDGHAGFDPALFRSFKQEETLLSSFSLSLETLWVRRVAPNLVQTRPSRG